MYALPSGISKRSPEFAILAKLTRPEDRSVSRRASLKATASDGLPRRLRPLPHRPGIAAVRASCAGSEQQQPRYGGAEDFRIHPGPAANLALEPDIRLLL
jgi:hypothetical protein